MSRPLGPHSETYMTMVSVAGPTSDLENLRVRMSSPAGISFCGLLPMPQEYDQQFFGSPSESPAPDLDWATWQAENWGPVGGEYSLVLTTNRPTDGDRSLLRFMFHTSGAPFNIEFYRYVSTLIPSSVLITITRSLESNMSSWATLCAGTVLSAAETSPLTRLVRDPNTRFSGAPWLAAFRNKLGSPEGPEDFHG